jgi:citrate synthase
MDPVDTKNIGLRGITVADSAISLVDGQQGRLLYRGYSIKDLANQASFEEVVYLLLIGRAPSEEELAETTRFMAEARSLPREVMDALKLRPKDARPMDVLQSAVAMLADHDPDVDIIERRPLERAAMRLIARTASVAVAWHHIRQGREVPEVDPSASHAAAFLEGIWGERPTEYEVRLMDLLLVLHAEHTLNASTFACREVASTRAHLYTSVSAGIGALSGALHGAANGNVMKMLLEIGDISRVDSWVKERLERGDRIMGLGHAVYKTEDPRAGILREVAAKALEGRAEEKWFHLALEVETKGRSAIKEHKGYDLYPNVDFFSGPVLYTIGLPLDMFPVLFAVSRVSGWSAHVIEEQLAEAQPKPALYRPRANYVGRYCGPEGCSWSPLQGRRPGCPEDPTKTCAE